MNTSMIEYVSSTTCQVGESPLWHPAQAAWFWVDIPSKTLRRYQPQSGTETSWTTPEMLANIALRKNGEFLAAMETGLFYLSLNDTSAPTCELVAALPEKGPGIRWNDGRTDRQGRYWSGSMFIDMGAAKAIGNLYRLTNDHQLAGPFVSELLTQNGLAWSPDGKTMYLSDSHPHRQCIWRFDYDISTGTPSNQTLFFDMRDIPGRPDGAAMDIEGCYWICGNDGSVVYRMTPTGKIDRKIDLPMKKPAMCSFGGDDGQSLLITSIRPDPSDPDPWAGKTILIRPGVQGMIDTPF